MLECALPWQALKRPGRLDREIYVGLPDDAARRQIFEILFRRTPVADDVSVHELVKRTQRYSGAEVNEVLSPGNKLFPDTRFQQKL